MIKIVLKLFLSDWLDMQQATKYMPDCVPSYKNERIHCCGCFSTMNEG